MRITTLMFAFAFAFALTGCELPDTGTGGTNNGGIDSTGKSQGQFVKAGDLDQADTSIYTAGCKANGSYEPTIQIDQRLKVGQVITASFKVWDNANKTMNYVTKNEIKTVSANSWTGAFELVEAKGAGVAAGAKGTQTCSLASNSQGKSEVQCDISGITQNEQPETLKDCYVDGGQPQLVAYEKGSFTFFKSGRTINAHRINYKVNGGELYCDGVKVGAGSSQVVLIRTNESPAEDGDFCGGVNIFGFISNNDEAGKNVTLLNFERLSD